MGRQPKILILGAGQAGFSAAIALRDEAFKGQVVLLNQESGLPYDRSKLSKAALANNLQNFSELEIRPEEYYDSRAIELKYGTAVFIDRISRNIYLESGERLTYDNLILALGVRGRELLIPGVSLPGVFKLRTLSDTKSVSSALNSATKIVAIGAGLIGMEFASAAGARGKSVTVVDPRERVLARSVSKRTSEYIAHIQKGNGSVLHLRQQCVALHNGNDGRVEQVELADTTILSADLVLIGVGVVPNSELAATAGLTVDDGIVVDEFLRTSDPAIFAIGDCARFPTKQSGRGQRIISIQNATDQARHVAATITGKSNPYRAVPAFWTEQFEEMLQIAGIQRGHDAAIEIGDTKSSPYSILFFRKGKMVAVESLNCPSVHMSAHKILASRKGLGLEVALKEDFTVESYARSLDL